MRFEPGELALLDQTEEVEIETARPDGPPHRTIIWVVVEGDDAYIRSVNGATARWYRETIANPVVTIYAAGRPVNARAVSATDPETVKLVSNSLQRKYARTDGLREMLEPEIFDTTLRLTPA
jgi:hypothetical protein